jgi:hypothetical protein
MLTPIQNLPYSHIGEGIDHLIVSFDVNPNTEIIFLKILTEVIL